MRVAACQLQGAMWYADACRGHHPSLNYYRMPRLRLLAGVTRGSAETTCLGHEASGLQAHPSDFSGRQLNDLVVRAAPYREGLLTTNVTLVPSSSSAARAAGEGASSTTSGPTAVPLSMSLESRPGSGVRSVGVAGGVVPRTGSGGNVPAAVVSGASTTAAAATESHGTSRGTPGTVQSAAYCGGSSGAPASAGDDTSTAVPTGGFASRVATLLLERSSDALGLHFLAQGFRTSTPAGKDAAAGAAQGAAAMPVDAEAMAGMRAAGTPAAAVSLLPLPEACEEQNVQVEVVELLPIKLGKGSFGRVQEGRYRGQRVAVKQALDLHDGLSVPTGKLVASFLQVQLRARGAVCAGGRGALQCEGIVA